MATLTDAITSTQRIIRVTTPGAPVSGGRYTIGDELIEFIGFGDGTYRQVEAHHSEWDPDETSWYVRRGIEGTTKATHAQGAPVTPFVVTTIEGGPGGSQTLAEVLAEGADADGNKITNLGAPSDPSDAARLQDVGGGGLPDGWVAQEGDTLDADGGSLIGLNGLVADAIDGVGTITGPIDGDVAFNSPIQVGELLYGNHTDVAIQISGSDIALRNTDGNATISIDGFTLALRDPGGDDMILIENDAMGFFGNGAVARPEAPATPNAQDVIDILVALGLCTQAAP